MTALFQRDCAINVGGTRWHGLRVQFRITKSLSPPNPATVTISNLSEEARKKCQGQSTKVVNPRMLARGMSGADVTAMQNALLKFAKPGQSGGMNPGPIDGIFGPQTEWAVRAFQGAQKQKDPSIQITGVVNAKTAALLGLPSGPSTVSVPGSRFALEAGYLNNLQQIFIGDARTVISTKDNEEWNTKIEADDGGHGFRNGRIRESFGPGTDIKQILQRAMASLTEDWSGAMKSLSGIDLGKALNGATLNGSSAKEIERILGGAGYTWSIQDGKQQVQPKGKPVAGIQAALISPSSGMIGSPEFGEGGHLMVKSLLRPDIGAGQAIVLQSATFKGPLYVEKLVHSGDFRGDAWFTELECRTF